MTHTFPQPVPDWVIECAFRYTLGRMAYVVSDMVDLLRTHWALLRPPMQERIQRDIVWAIDHGCAGMDMDVRQWQTIVDLPVGKVSP